MSRHTDRAMVECQDCHWKGTRADCSHGYHSSSMDEETNPEDRCPICDSPDLAELEGKWTQLEFSPA